MQYSHSFLYEREEDGAVILRCFLRDGNVEIPAELDGTPVCALSPYAFSAFQEEDWLLEARRENLLPDLPAMCGERLIRIFLPDPLVRVGKYCFYNCENLEELQFGAKLFDWGSGAFSGCHHIRSVRVRTGEEEECGLRHLLSEISEELTVRLGDAVLVFPEFYEESVENTPARILVTQVHGTGILYRNCFAGGRFDFEQYDALFPYAAAQEGEELLAVLVTARLRFPYALGAAAKARYESYAQEHLIQFGNYFLQSQDPQGLDWLLRTFSPSDKDLNALSAAAAAALDAQMQSILMEYRHKNPDRRNGRKRLTL